MPKTVFIRKPGTLDDVVRYTRRAEQPTDLYYVAEEVQLDEQEFFDLHENMLADRRWIAEFSNRDYPMRGRAVPAIRVTCKHSATVLIIDTQGYDYARYVGMEWEEASE